MRLIGIPLPGVSLNLGHAVARKNGAAWPNLIDDVDAVADALSEDHASP